MVQNNTSESHNRYGIYKCLFSGEFGSQYAMEHFEAEERTRMVTKFNCFIAPRRSRLHQLDSMSQMAMDEMCNGILWQGKSLNEDSVALLESLTIG